MTDGGQKFLCVHGHFYQPPREDPFTGKVPREPGAEPFHDFNEKITAECYRPNARLGNFGRISFDLGPTLASWLTRHDRATYRAVIGQERAHRERYGVGNSLAHVYSHSILPLATDHEKRIQVEWGVADFRYRFAHEPEGMWLAETAADSASLGALLDAGIQFTVLAPWQAAEPVDTSEAHWVRLSDGRRIAAFFFNGELSGRVSFDSHATTDADAFGQHDLGRQVLADKLARGEQQLILVATDGELYGHHQPYRDKFLAHLLQVSAPAQGFQVTTLARHLRAHPPRREVRLAEATSWSCHHGVERWRGDCPCSEGDGRWKSVLRLGLAKLAEQLDTRFERTGGQLLRDPWAAEREYIQVRIGSESKDVFWDRHSRQSTLGRQRAFRLLESQYHRHLMFASCAWFFDDLDRIEPRNAIAYGLRAARLAESAHRVDLMAGFANDLRRARSWRTGRTGRDLLREIASGVGASHLRSEDRPNHLALAG